MNTAPRFVPLVCPNCSGDLVGRARDVLAFCPACLTAHATTRDNLVSVKASHVTSAPAGEGPTIALPFFTTGGQAVPAFLCARPLALARAASVLLPKWTVLPGLAHPFPLGARLGPEAAPPIARLARLAPGPGPGAFELLAVSARRTHSRWLLPGTDAEFVPDDVLEGDDLLRRCEGDRRAG